MGAIDGEGAMARPDACRDQEAEQDGKEVLVGGGVKNISKIKWLDRRSKYEVLQAYYVSISFQNTQNYQLKYRTYAICFA